MILCMWSQNADGEKFDEFEYPATDVANATSILVTELTDTASDEFMHSALEQWFKNGFQISNLPEDKHGRQFWNVRLTDMCN